MKSTITDDGAARSSKAILFIAIVVLAAACSGGQEPKTLRAGAAAGASLPESSTTVQGEVTTTQPSVAPASSSDAPAGAATGPVPAPPKGRDSSPNPPPGDTQRPLPPPPEKKNSHRSYPAGGAVDDVFPPGTPAYTLLASGDCKELLRQIDQGNPEYQPDPSKDPVGIPPWFDSVPELLDEDTYRLYRSAAEACLLQWDLAASDFARISAPPGFAPRQRVYEWAAALLADHRADPNFVPDFS